MSEKKSFVEFEYDDSGNVSGVVILDDNYDFVTMIDETEWLEIKSKYGVDESSDGFDLSCSVRSYFHDKVCAYHEKLELGFVDWLCE